MPTPENSREPPENKQLKNNRTLAPPDDLGTIQFVDQQASSDLFATIKNGTANVDSLKLMIPGFEILEELGRGAFGVVYRARDEKLDRQVAIKVSLLDDPARREQYIKEAKNAAKLENPGIVPVFQVGTLAAGQPFVVQRLIDGSTLRKMLTESGSLELRHACWLMSEIAGAVAKAHSLGMIHRDLKPDNILIDSTGKPWVADFGLAILEEDQRQHTGEKAGTPLYMSPEQLRGRTEWLDGRADIYAMGVMLYEMLVGRTPFDAQNLAELEEQVLHRDPKPISQRIPSIPAVMDVIFQNCCAKQVNDRYSNAYEFVADLEAVMAELPQTQTQVPLPDKAFAGPTAGRRASVPIAVSARRKTLRQSAELRSTLREQPVVKELHRFRWLLVLTGLAASIAFLVWLRFWNGIPAATEQASVSNGLVEPIPGEPRSESDPEPSLQMEPQVQIPERPFRVSKGSNGTHTTLRAAIAMAEPDETITILPGNYVESVILDRSVRLVGEGKREDIVIIGENEAALVVTGDISAELANLTLEGNKTGDREFNTIDVLGGSLTLTQCNVYSRSYDCVKIQPGCGMAANDCNFRTTAHPAVRAENSRSLRLVDCEFDIRPQTLEDKSIPVGVQALNCAGVVQRCNFSGSGSAIGIHWQAAEGLVSIQDATLQNCESGIILQDCHAVEIKGSVRTKLSGCNNGLLLERCEALIESIDINGTQCKTGIRLIDSGETHAAARVQILDAKISGYDVSLSVERAQARVKGLRSSDSAKTGIQLVSQSALELENSFITENETGILIEDATATLVACEIAGNNYAGVSVDAKENALNAVGCTFKDNIGGLIISAGSAVLRGSVFQSNAVGVLVVPRDLLGPSVARVGENAPVFLDIEDVNFVDNKNGGMLIRAACSYRLVRVNFLDVDKVSMPKLSDDLRAEQQGELTFVRANRL